MPLRRHSFAAAVITLSLMVAAPAAPPPAWTTTRPEAALLYRGKPIHPQCMWDLVNAGRRKSIDLGACNAPNTKDGKLFPAKQDHAFFSAELRHRDDDVFMRGDPFTSYGVLAARGNEFIVRNDSEEGGTGIFSTLMHIRLDGQKLVLMRVLQSGDRCGGGVGETKATPGVVRYSANITPHALMELAGVKRNSLPDGLAVCGGTQDMEYDLNTGRTRMVSAHVNKDFPTGFNACLERMVAAQTKWGKLVFSLPELTAFGQDYVRKCGNK